MVDYPTNYDSFYTAKIAGGFDMRSRRNLDEKRNSTTQLSHYIAPTEINCFAPLHAFDPKHTCHKNNDEDMFLVKDYVMHMGTKLDYFFFQSSMLLQASETQL